MKYNCMLAHIYDPKRVKFPAYTQPKLNGVRAIFMPDNNGTWRFFSRQGNILSVPHIEQNINRFRVQSGMLFTVPLDGELYIHGRSFDYISGLVRLQTDPEGKKEELEYHIYDTQSKSPFFLRYQDIWHTSNKVIRVQTKMLEYSTQYNEIMVHHHINLAEGYEGTMIRNNAAYEFKRSFNLLKLKSWQNMSCTIKGLNEGTGKYEGMLGSFTVQNKSGKVFNVSGKISDLDRQLLYNRKNVIGKQIYVKYRDLNEYGIPVPATFECFVEELQC